MQKIISLSIAFCLFWNPCFTQDTENISPSTESEEPGKKEKRERLLTERFLPRFFCS